MRLFKSSGGVARGLGITNSTVSSFGNVITHFIPICTFLENFTGVVVSSPEQHKDLCSSNLCSYRSCSRRDVGGEAANSINRKPFSEVHLSIRIK